MLGLGCIDAMGSSHFLHAVENEFEKCVNPQLVQVILSTCLLIKLGWKLLTSFHRAACCVGALLWSVNLEPIHSEGIVQ